MIQQNSLAYASSYKDLQKQLNQEHQRLLKQREQMLSKQNERIQLYQKLDLVQFFNYSPSKSDSKQKIMYHLSAKFKDYMRKLTENNVYKRMGHLVNEKQNRYFDQKSYSELQKSRNDNSQRKSDKYHSKRNSSSKSRESNLERNSDLGRMFQTLRYYQQQYQSDSNKNIQRKVNYSQTPRKQQKHQNNVNQNPVKKYEQSDYGYLHLQNTRPVSNYVNRSPSYQDSLNQKKLSKYENPVISQYQRQQQISKHYRSNSSPSYKDILNNFQNYLNSSQKDQRKSQTQNNIPQSSSSIGFQLNQLKNALSQQQKIYLLTQVNHYIKLFKQSQVKRQFLQRHLDNLHSFILQIKQKKYSTSSKDRSQSKSKYEKTRNDLKTQLNDHYLKKQNQMLKNQLKIYINELQTLKKFNQEDFSAFNQNQNLQKNNNLLKNNKKCVHTKKIDRFKQFAQHIHIMQNQLDSLNEKVNILQNSNLNFYQTAKFNTQESQTIKQLKDQIRLLQNTIENEEIKKIEFFQEVKKFKQIMNLKNEEISQLQNKIGKCHTMIDELKKQKNELLTKKNRLDWQLSSVKKDYSTQNLKRFGNQQSKNEDISHFINRTLNSPKERIISQKQFRSSTITTNPPSDFQFADSNVQSNTQNDQISSILYERPSNLTRNLFTKNQHQNNSYSPSKSNQYDAYSSSNQRRNSKSISKYSSRSQSKQSLRLKSKTDYNQSYEPKPYERYNHISEYQFLTHTQTTPLYQRITENN